MAAAAVSPCSAGVPAEVADHAPALPVTARICMPYPVALVSPESTYSSFPPVPTPRPLPLRSRLPGGVQISCTTVQLASDLSTALLTMWRRAYEVISAARTPAGAFHTTVSAASPAVTDETTGAPTVGVPAEVADQAPSPLEFTARTCISYAVPPSSPTTVYDRLPEVQTPSKTVWLASDLSDELLVM